MLSWLKSTFGTAWTGVSTFGTSGRAAGEPLFGAGAGGGLKGFGWAACSTGGGLGGTTTCRLGCTSAELNSLVTLDLFGAF